MKIALIGDIVGKPGREALLKHLPKLKQHHSIDFVVANGENVSHGFGISIAHADALFGAGVDIITGGNHSFDKKEIIPMMDKNPKILRPHNLSPQLSGSGLYMGEVCGEGVGVLNIMGHFGMPNCDNAFRCLKDGIETFKANNIKNIIVDFHAEATSEKRSAFEMSKGEITALFGTHTHIGTDDLMIENGSFYVSDVGMCGAFDSVIGMDSYVPMQRGLNNICTQKLEIPSKYRAIFGIIIVESTQGVANSATKIKIIDGVDNIDEIKAVRL